MAQMQLEQLANELGVLLGRVAGVWSWNEPTRGKSSSAVSRVGMACEDGRYSAWVQSQDGEERVVLTCAEGSDVISGHENLLRKIISVFDHDLAVIGASAESSEVWSELSETRFLRAAVRLSNISTEHLLRRIRTFEAASRQTYEGSPFVGSVVMAHSLTTFQARAADRFRRFAEDLTFDRALLSEKWLKPFLATGDFALVTTSYRGIARGFTDASRPWADSEEPAPTRGLEGLYGYLQPGTSVLSATAWGDIYFALPSRITFVNSKGRWRYQNWAPLRAILEKRCPPAVADQVLRLVQGSSYEHRGALYAILPNDVAITDVIPDHGAEGRSAQILRSATGGSHVVDPTSLELLGVASRIDGAVILAEDGRVLDVACMIAEPSPKMLTAAGHNQLMRFAGARSTAAWNASISGLAVKISDDGPVDVFESGQLVFHAD